MIKTIIVEDDINIHKKIKKLVERIPQIDTLKSFLGLSCAIKFCKHHKIDLVILDISLPDGKGTDLIHYLSQHQPDCLISMLTIYDDYPTFTTTLELGIDGYIVKTASEEEITTALSHIIQGNSYLSPEVACYLLKKYKKKASSNLPWQSNLSNRETEVLRLLSTGLSYSKIAQKLDIKYNTVCSHIKNIYQKLDATSKSEAIYMGIKKGLVSVD